MAVILSQITIGDHRLIIADSAPYTGVGLTAEIGSMVIVSGQGGIYLKTGESDLDWKLSTVDATQIGLDLDAIRGRLDVLETDPTTKSYVDGQVAILVAAVTAEENRAKGIEAGLRADLSTEVSDRQAAVSAEETRAMGVEAGLQTQISQEVSARQDAISSEQARAESAEAQLQSAINAEQVRAEGVEAGLRTDLSEEISRATGVDSALQVSINDEQIRAEGIEAGLRADLTAEISRAQAAEGVLTSDLASEVSSRQSEISRIETLVSEENLRALQIESGLQDQISGEILARQASDSALSDRLNVLETDPVTKSYVDSADASLQSQINNLSSNMDPAALDSLTEIVAAFQAADSSLNGAISALGTGSTSALGEEISRAQAAEAQLAADLAGEQSARTAADESLSARLSSLEADPTTKTYVDQQVSLEASNRDSQVTAEQNRAQAAESEMLKLDGSRPMIGDLDLGSHKIKNVENITVGIPQRLDGQTNPLGSAVVAGPAGFPTNSMRDSTAIFRVVGSQSTNNIQFGMGAGAGNIGWGSWVQSSYDNDTDVNPTSMHMQPLGGKLSIGDVAPSALFNVGGDAKIVGHLYMDFHKILNVADGVDSSDGINKGQLDAEVARAMGVESGLQSSIDSEVSARQSAISDLQNTINNTISTSISDEVAARQAGDSALDSRLQVLEADPTTKSYVDSEILSRQSEISRVEGLIGSEETSRQNAVSDLQNQITVEVSNRQAAVSAEASARQDADSSLQSNIDAEQSARISADNSLQDLISSEESSRISGDAATLQGAKDYADSQDATKLVEAKSYTDTKISDLINGAPGVLDTLKEIADQLGNDENVVAALTNTVAANLQTAKDYADGKVATEKSERQSDVSSLQSQLSQEVSDRQSAVLSEQERAQAEEATMLKLDGSRPMEGSLDMGNNHIVSIGALGIGTSDVTSGFSIVDNNVRYDKKMFSTETSGSVNAIVASITPSLNSVQLAKIMVTGFDSASNDSVAYERTVRIKNNSGTLSLGTIQADYTSEDPGMGSAGCTFVVNASDVDVRVTGVNRKTITWKCIVEVMK